MVGALSHSALFAKTTPEGLLSNDDGAVAAILAEHGGVDDARAQYEIAKHLIEASDGSKASEQAIESWLLKASQQDLAEADILLAERFALQRNLSRMYRFIAKAALNGSARGQYHFYNMYYFGQGVAQDDHQAYRWLVKAAEGGDSQAMLTLGALLDPRRDGKDSVERNDPDKYFQEITDKRLAFMKKVGMEKNEEKALAWLTRSASLNNRMAKEHLKTFHGYSD